MASQQTLLSGVRVVTIAVNLPGPWAAAQFTRLGASVTKVEPPAGDPFRQLSPSWYAELAVGQEVVTIDLKSEAGRADLERRLAESDVFITSHRRSALTRLGLDWPQLHSRFPRLIHLEIVGHESDPDLPGHDLTYQAMAGTLTPPHTPVVLIADLAGGERGALDATAALFARERTGEGSHQVVALEDAAIGFAAPARHGTTARDSWLGGSFPLYAIHPAREGWVALAALEPHFAQRCVAALGIEGTPDDLPSVWRSRTALEWEQWAAAEGVPLMAVRGPDGQLAD